MPQYTLDLSIDAANLQIMKAAQLKITIAKPVGASSPNVTWLVFDPFQGNKVQWEEQYSIYASPNQVIQNGAVITRLSETDFPANDAAYYSFDSTATFQGPFIDSDAPPRGSYKAINNMPNTQYPALTFGLQQKASINSKGINPSPLNAAVVPAMFPVTFTPLTTVYVWLQASYTSGTVITRVNGNATIVTFGGSVTEKSLVYNPATGTFIPSSAGNVTALDSFAALASFDDPDVKILKQAGVY
ncbi:hypothetical protein ACQY1Y_21710 [Microcystis ichthyoblabe FBCC-A1114]|uniref:hypothetical protein n=1 Tax=Microcystis TaxID=1125 RepID=UPI003D274073